MKVIDDKINLIIIGKWNRYILSPAWISKNLFHNKTIEIEVGIDLDLPPRYTHENVRIIPTQNAVNFFALKYDDLVLTRIENMVYELTTILEHTPVRAYGINFGFIEEENIELSKIFNISDNTKLTSFGLRIDGYSLKRHLIRGGQIINLTISQEDKGILFGINFHTDVKKPKNISDNIKGMFVENKKICEKLLSEVYDLKLEK